MQEKLIDSEKKVERALYNAVKDKNGLCLKLVTSQFSGLPDRLILLPKGIVFFVETKTTGIKPRKLQIKVHEIIRKLGLEVYIIDTVKSAQQLIDIKAV